MLVRLRADGDGGVAHVLFEFGVGDAALFAFGTGGGEFGVAGGFVVVVWRGHGGLGLFFGLWEGYGLSGWGFAVLGDACGFTCCRTGFCGFDGGSFGVVGRELVRGGLFVLVLFALTPTPLPRGEGLFSGGSGSSWRFGFAILRNTCRFARGGVHFTMQVDMKAAMQKTFERYSGDIRREMRREKIRTGTIRQIGNGLVVPMQDAADVQKAMPKLRQLFPEANLNADGNNITLTLSEEAINKVRSDAVKQNITTLHNRVNELGVAEPVIQQSGLDRIVVQLPGVQDTAKAKDIIGRTATLEVRMVEDDPVKVREALEGNVPSGFELLSSGGDHPETLLINKQVELTGDNINDAQPGFDQMEKAVVNLSLDSAGSNIFGELTAANIRKRMAMVLIDQGKSEIITAPVINSAITGGRVQISGSMTTAEANDISLLMRAGSLAAPMQIVEERTIGPSLGKENIEKGFHSTLWGFTAVALFMVVYYRLMGFFSTIALSTNILFLVGILSAMQATLTLPGIAALALTLGMAIDSNVLINERIREELREGVPPQQAINLGFQHAWATIVDSNLTSLIAGIALLVFGSGPVRGFAVVHCLGILTSMYSSVVVFRALVNLWYGRRRKLQNISIGAVWKPKAETAAGKE